MTKLVNKGGRRKGSGLGRCVPFTIMLTEGEDECLRKLAAAEGVTRSAFVRRLIWERKQK